MNSVIKEYGEPFSMDVSDTDGHTRITTIRYKSRKDVSLSDGFIVTTELRFVNDSLAEIQQKDFYVPNSVIMSDSLVRVR